MGLLRIVSTSSNRNHLEDHGPSSKQRQRYTGLVFFKMYELLNAFYFSSTWLIHSHFYTIDHHKREKQSWDCNSGNLDSTLCSFPDFLSESGQAI